MTERRDGRAPDDLRPITIERAWSAQAEGSAASPELVTV